MRSSPKRSVGPRFSNGRSVVAGRLRSSTVLSDARGPRSLRAAPGLPGRGALNSRRSVSAAGRSRRGPPSCAWFRSRRGAEFSLNDARGTRSPVDPCGLSPRGVEGRRSPLAEGRGPRSLLKDGRGPRSPKEPRVSSPLGLNGRRSASPPDGRGPRSPDGLRVSSLRAARNASPGALYGRRAESPAGRSPRGALRSAAARNASPGALYGRRPDSLVGLSLRASGAGLAPRLSPAARNASPGALYGRRPCSPAGPRGAPRSPSDVGLAPRLSPAARNASPGAL